MYENDPKLAKEISPEQAAQLQRQNYENNFVNGGAGNDDNDQPIQGSE